MEHHMMTKFHLNDFVHGMAVNARRTGLSILETTDPLGFSCTNIARQFLRQKESNVVLARCVSVSMNTQNLFTETQVKVLPLWKSNQLHFLNCHGDATTAELE